MAQGEPPHTHSAPTAHLAASPPDDGVAALLRLAELLQGLPVPLWDGAPGPGVSLDVGDGDAAPLIAVKHLHQRGGEGF